MKLSAKKILRVVLPITVLLISNHVLGQDQPEGDQLPDTKRE